MIINPEEVVDSADQDQWAELGAIIRAELMKRTAKINEMCVSDLHSFICCCRDAFINEINGRTYDNKLYRAQNFGD